MLRAQGPAWGGLGVRNTWGLRGLGAENGARAEGLQAQSQGPWCPQCWHKPLAHSTRTIGGMKEGAKG